MLAKSVLRPTVVQRGVVPFKPVRLNTTGARISKPVSPLRCEAAAVAEPAPTSAAVPAVAVDAVVAGSEEGPSGPKSGFASHKFQRGSVHKVRRILDIIRNKSYESSLIICQMLPYKACEPIVTLLMSAAANAKHNNGAIKSKLRVSVCYADGGPSLKRIRPRAQGRACKILKPTFHLYIKVEETFTATAKDAEKFRKGLAYKIAPQPKL